MVNYTNNTYGKNYSRFNKTKKFMTGAAIVLSLWTAVGCVHLKKILANLDTGTKIGVNPEHYGLSKEVRDFNFQSGQYRGFYSEGENGEILILDNITDKYDVTPDKKSENKREFIEVTDINKLEALAIRLGKNRKFKVGTDSVPCDNPEGIQRQAIIVYLDDPLDREVLYLKELMKDSNYVFGVGREIYENQGSGGDGAGGAGGSGGDGASGGAGGSGGGGAGGAGGGGGGGGGGR